jgi:oxalate decarboxylase/phosphoglucose isomerase-like protein (cupin superfamily)
VALSKTLEREHTEFVDRPQPISGTIFLEIVRSDYFADVSLAQWLKFTPHELVRAHLNIDKSVLAKIPTRKTPVVER